MENLLFSLNVTMPLFLLMVLGALFRKLNWMDKDFASKLNSYVFKIALPATLFKDLANADIAAAWDTKFVLFCFLVTCLSILTAFLISCLWKDKTIQGEFVQASYRSSAALLGTAIIQNIYGNSGMAPLMIVASVPLYNTAAVVVLSFLRPGQKAMDKERLKSTCVGILKNPLIIGIVVGLLWSLLRLPMPTILSKTVTNIGSTATPLGLMAMGASFELEKAFHSLKPAVTASLIKLFGFCIVFLPIAIALGFRNEHLIAILVMLGSATTVSSYVMARNMGHEGTLTSSVVMITTLFVAVSMTFWLFLLKTIAVI